MGHLFTNRILSSLRRFATDVGGTAAVLNLTWFSIVGAGAGFAIDVSNARQSKEHLTVSSEAASHAGLVKLVEGGSVAEVRQAALSYVEQNIPVEIYGTVIANSNTDVKLLNWDPKTGNFSALGTPNAVQVTLHRDATVSNPVSTFLLDFIGFDSWEFTSSSATVHAPIARCNNTEGIFALGSLDVQSYNQIGAGTCLYTADYVSIGEFNYFEQNASIVLPDLTDCGACLDDTLNPGIVLASSEGSYMTTDIESLIADTQLSFLGGGPAEIKDNFFLTKNLDADLSPLVDLGINAFLFSLGDTVSLTAEQFAGLTTVPKGLTYDVTCAAAANGDGGDGDEGLLGEGLGGALDNLGGAVDDALEGAEISNITTLDFSAAPITDVAIITNCALDFSSGSALLGSTVLTTHADGVGDSMGAQIGAQDASCSAQDRVTVLTNNDIGVQAQSIANNVSLIANGAINLATGGAGVSDHYGVAMYSAGDISLTSNHGYYGCGAPDDENLPEMMVIRQVNPAKF